MLSLVLAVILGQAGSVSYRPPANVFDPSEMSSEAVFAGMHVCFEQRGGFAPAKIPLCGCLMDAARFNLKRGNRDTTPTKEQYAKCAAAMPKPPPPQPKSGKGKTGT